MILENDKPLRLLFSPYLLSGQQEGGVVHMALDGSDDDVHTLKVETEKTIQPRMCAEQQNDKGVKGLWMITK